MGTEPKHQSLTLITGPTRSGKSEWAEQLASQSGRSVLYIATALVEASDQEWQNRIARHQARRPPEWQTLAVPVALAQAIVDAPPNSCLLVDSLGTWLANLLEQDELLWQHTQTELLESLRQTECDVILVAEEVGWGVVPAYPLGRSFRDRLGSLVRQIGTRADRVYLVTAGYALDLKQLGQPVLGIG